MAKSQSENRTESHPRESVELPRATSWPIVISMGIALAALGAATSVAFSVVGGVLFFVGVAGFIGELLPGRGHELEPLVEPAARAKPVVARSGLVEPLKPGVIGYRFQLPQQVHPVSAGFKGGLIGGALMAVTALGWGLWSGNGIWFPGNLLAGMVLPGIDDMPLDQLRGFHAGWLVLAIVLHLAMSIGLGLIYGVILPTLPPVPGGPLLFGGVILPALWTGASYGLMGIVNPALNEYVAWGWYVASQLVYGIATSLVIMLSEKIPIAPRGTGDGSASPPGGTAIGCLALGAALFAGCSDNLPGKPIKADEFVRPSAVTDFATLYSERCAACHGANGAFAAGPPLSDPLFVKLATDEELRSVIAGGRAGTLMPAWSNKHGGPLTDEQIASLVAGIKQTQTPLEALESNDSMSSEAPPLLAASRAAGPGDALSGEKLFETACASCHGSNGMGTDDGKKLRINHPAFLALMSDVVLRRYIITGRPDLGMPDFAGGVGRPADFKPLTDQQVSDLSALLRTWRKAAEARYALEE